MEFTIEVNNKKIKAIQGETILSTLKRNNMYVPTLCHMKDLNPTGACRICVVEVEGARNLITACSFPVSEGMKIKTHSQRVITARKTITELLLSNHPDDCLYCVRNNNCELQTLAAELNVRERRISGSKNKYNLDLSSLSIVREPAKCILCGRCVRVCEEVEGVSAIDFTGRGSKTVIQPTYKRGLNISSCINCGQCIMNCPTGALSEKSHIADVQDALHNTDKIVMIQYAPSISVTIAEEFGLPAGTEAIGLMNAALRKIGFDVVFDTSTGSDLTIMEESAELIHRIQNGGVLPMFTSCCPGWVKYAEQSHPDFIPNLSSCKSPHQMVGAMTKEYWTMIENVDKTKVFNVSIMPCTAKKFEMSRDEMMREGIADVDAVLTTRELVQLIKLYGIDMPNLEPELADSLLGTRSSAGKIFGASGGVMEAAIRTAFFKITGKELIKFQIPEVRGFEGRKEAKIQIGGLELGVAVVSGLAQADKLIKEIRAGRTDIHFVEVMACPGGCIAGGGQPIGADEAAIKARMKALYAIDASDSIRSSHRNPSIMEIYKDFLGEPLGHKSHELLHTHYHKRDDVLL